MFKLLVVEDNRDLNRTVCSYLMQHGYTTVGCLDAQSAYDAMYQDVFDLILSDIMMPGIDGFEFAGTVRELNQNIPILFMTARDDLSAKQQGFQAGIDDYMVKPIDRKSCCCASARCCGGQKSRPANGWTSAISAWMQTNALLILTVRKSP